MTDIIYNESVAELARILHESGREAVEQKKVYRDDLPVKPFCEWDDLHEAAREGRFMMARFLLAHPKLDLSVRLEF